MNPTHAPTRALAAFHARQRDTRDSNQIRVAQEVGLTARSMDGTRTLASVVLLKLEITGAQTAVPGPYIEVVYTALQQVQCRGLLVVVEGPANACEDFMVTILPERMGKPALDHYREFIAMRIPYDLAARPQIHPVALADFARLQLMMDRAKAGEKPAAGDA